MASKTTFVVSTDSNFLTEATQMSKLDRTYSSLDSRVERMPEHIREKFMASCQNMMMDYNLVLDFTTDYIKDLFNNRKTGLVTKMTQSGRLWHPKYNPDGITELVRIWKNPKKICMEALGFGLGKDYHKPDEFHFAFNTLWEGGCWKKNRSGEQFFSNDYFLHCFRDHRITVPSGVSAVAVLTKRKLSPSFIRVTDISDKSKSDMEVWEIRFFYKQALEFASKKRAVHAVSTAEAVGTAEAVEADEADEAVEADEADEADEAVEA
jgi:hypothetical protein